MQKLKTDKWSDKWKRRKLWESWKRVSELKSKKNSKKKEHVTSSKAGMLGYLSGECTLLLFIVLLFAPAIIKEDEKYYFTLSMPAIM